MDQKTEVVELRRAVEGLTARVVALESGTTRAIPKAAEKQDEGVSITAAGNNPPARLYPAEFAAPTDEDLRRLFAIGKGAVLRIKADAFTDPRGSEEKTFGEFCAAFRYLAHVRRADKIDYSKGVINLIDQFDRWPGKGIEHLTGYAVLAAVFAHGDIDGIYSAENPASACFALSPYVGELPKGAWRDVLASGASRRIRPGRYGAAGRLEFLTPAEHRDPNRQHPGFMPIDR
jgi:hypothetical protein